MTGHLLVLVQGRHGVAATLLGAGCAIGYVWFAPRGRLLELNHNWWQVAVCVSYVVVGLTFLCVLRPAALVRKEAAQPPESHRPNGRWPCQTYGLLFGEHCPGVLLRT